MHLQQIKFFCLLRIEEIIDTPTLPWLASGKQTARKQVFKEHSPEAGKFYSKSKGISYNRAT